MVPVLLALALGAASPALASPPYKTGVFQLVRTAGQGPGQGCDVYTRLVLDNAELAGHVAFMGQRYAGDCGEPIDRQARDYPLFHDSTDACGSVVWNGEFIHGGDYHLRLTDHRFRHCADQVPAKLVIEETSPDGTVVTMYAAPN